jgi:hypothetical protein
MTPPVSAKERDEFMLTPPHIDHDEPFGDIVKKLSVYVLPLWNKMRLLTFYSYIIDAIGSPSTLEQLRTTSTGSSIRILVDDLVDNVTNPALIHAILYVPMAYSF